MRCEQASQSRAIKALRVGGVSDIRIRTIKALGVVGVSQIQASQIQYSNSSLSTEFIKFIYGDGVWIILIYGRRQRWRRSKAGAVSTVEHSCSGKQEASLVQKGQRYKEQNEEEYKQMSGVS